jgi:hypothetical protein
MFKNYVSAKISSEVYRRGSVGGENLPLTIGFSRRKCAHVIKSRSN